MKEAPQPGFAGDGGAQREPSYVAVGYPPPKEPPQPGFAPGDGGAQRQSSFVAVGYPPPKEPPVPGAAALAATSQELVDRVQAARWQVWNRQAAALPDGYVLSVELIHSQPGQAFAVVTRVVNRRAVRSIVGAPVKMTATGDPASPGMIALGSPPPQQPADPGVIAQVLSLLSTAFGTEAGSISSPGQ